MGVKQKLWLQAYAIERLMSYIVALMTYTVFVAVLGSMAVQYVGSQPSLSTRMLGKIVFEEGAQKRIDRSVVEDALRKRLDGLREVERYAFVESDSQDAILAPHNVPDPIFVEIYVRTGSIQAPAVERALQMVSPLIQVADVPSPHVSMGDLRMAELACVGLMILSVFGAVAVIALASQAGLVVNRRVVGTMMMMGATPAYIVRQFQRHTMRMAGYGVGLGMGAMLITLVVVYSMSMYYGHQAEQLCPPLIVISSFIGIPVFVTLFVLLSTDLSIRQCLRQSVDHTDAWSV